MANFHKHWYGTLAQYNALATKDSNTLYHCSEGLIYRGSVLLATRRWGDLSGVPSTFAPSAHTHTKSQITDFPTTWAWASLTGVPSTFTPSAHTHDDRYYTETEVGKLFAGTTAITGYNKDNWDGVVTDFGNLQIGGRNYAKGTSKRVRVATWSGWDYILDTVRLDESVLRYGDKLVFRVWLEPVNTNARAFLDFRSDDGGYRQFNGSNVVEGESGYSVVTAEIPSTTSGNDIHYFTIKIRDSNNSPNTSVKYHSPKVEKGTKPTDWTPAPEDVDASIATVQTNLDTHAALTNNPHSVTKSQVGLGNVENTKLSTWAGSGSITALGTVVSGTWSASTISVTKGGTGKTSVGKDKMLYASAANTYAEVTTTSFGRGLLSAVSGTVVSGLHAATATILHTERKINGVDFNGSANITVTANTPYTLTRGRYLTGSNFNGSANTTWAVDATSANTAGKVVARDSNGDFACRIVNAATGVHSLKVVTGGHNYASQTYGVGIGTDGSNSGVIFYNGTGATGRIFRDADVLRFIRGGLSYSGFDINANGSITVQGDMTTRTSLVVGSTNGTYVQIGSARLVYDQTNNAIKVVNADNSSCSLYATGSISAFGIGSSGGSGGSGTSYSRLDDWADYVDGLTNDYVLSAELGYDLHTRVNSLNSFKSGTSWGNSGTGIANLSIGGTVKLVSLYGHTHAFSAIANKPTTLGGYGITNALPSTGGTLHNDVFNILELKRNSGLGASIKFSNNNEVLAKLGFDNGGSFIISRGTSPDGTTDMLYIHSHTKQITGYGGLKVSGSIEAGTSDGTYVRIGDSRFLYDRSISGLLLLSVSGGYSALRAGSVFANNVELTSSRSMKKDIQPFKNGLDLIKSINVVSYLYKQDSDDDDRKIGFIADDTDSWLSGKSKTKYNIGNTVGALIKAVQELEKKNQELEQRLLSITNNN